MNKTKQSFPGDNPWCTANNNDQFSLESVLNLSKNKNNYCANLSQLWCKGLLFKLSFIAWRTRKGQVPIDALMHTWNPTFSDIYGCCTSPIVGSIK